MGTNTCKCIVEDSQPQSLKLLHRNQSTTKTTANSNRIRSIASMSPSQKNQSKSKHQSQLILHSHNQSLVIHPDNKIQTIGTNKWKQNYQVIPQNKDDLFQLSVRYLENSGRQREGGYYVKDQGQGLGCFYKLGEDEKIELKNRSLVGIGNLFIIPMMDEVSISSQAGFEQTNFQLKIFGGSSQGQTFKISDNSPGYFLIGNTPQCAIRLKDTSISGVCAVIKKQDGQLILSSLGDTDIWIYMSHTTKLTNGMILKCGMQYYKVQIK